MLHAECSHRRVAIHAALRMTARLPSPRPPREYAAELTQRAVMLAAVRWVPRASHVPTSGSARARHMCPGHRDAESALMTYHTSA